MAAQSKNGPDAQSMRRDFFIASDEGDVWSEDVNAIKKCSDERTYLKRRNGLNSATINAPIEIVRAIFHDHGYEFISEGDLMMRTEEWRKARPA